MQLSEHDFAYTIFHGAVAAELAEVAREILDAGRYAVTGVGGPPPDMPLSTSGRDPKRCVFLNQRGVAHGAVMISNLSDGWGTLARAICRRRTDVVATLFQARENVSGMVLKMERCEAGESARVVQLFREGRRFTFFERGEPLVFESTERYADPVQRQKLDRPLLLAYSARCGWKPSDWVAVDSCYLVEEHG